MWFKYAKQATCQVGNIANSWMQVSKSPSVGTMANSQRQAKGSYSMVVFWLPHIDKAFVAILDNSLAGSASSFKGLFMFLSPFSLIGANLACQASSLSSANIKTILAKLFYLGNIEERGNETK